MYLKLYFIIFTQVSVFERSREDLIKEIIVIDDNNGDPKIGSALAKLEKVLNIDLTKFFN